MTPLPALPCSKGCLPSWVLLILAQLLLILAQLLLETSSAEMAIDVSSASPPWDGKPHHASENPNLYIKNKFNHVSEYSNLLRSFYQNPKKN